MRRGKGQDCAGDAEQQAIVAHIAGVEERITEFEAGAHQARVTSGTPRSRPRAFMLSGAMRSCGEQWGSGEALSRAGAETVRSACPAVLCIIDQQ